VEGERGDGAAMRTQQDSGGAGRYDDNLSYFLGVDRNTHNMLFVLLGAFRQLFFLYTSLSWIKAGSYAHCEFF